MDRLTRALRFALCRRLRVIWIIAALLAAPAAHSGAQAAAPVVHPLSQYDLEAAFLLNFARFVTWPSSAFADAASPFAICIVGHDPFGSALDQLVVGETVNGRHVVVRRLRAAPEPKSCQMLFVGSMERDISAFLANLGPGVLTVADEPGFLRAGGMIQFAIEGRHVRFDISQQAASRADLTLSARLLGVARSVQKE